MVVDFPIRILTAVPLCDGHDSAIVTVNQELVRNGFEVIYMGYHRAAEDIVRAAVQEDVAAVGISSYNGGHVEFFRQVRQLLDKAGRSDIGLFGGGGGTITLADVSEMKSYGVDEIFLAGTPFEKMVQKLRNLYGDKRTELPDLVEDDLSLAQMLTAVENQYEGATRPANKGHAVVVGFTGPGGAGKTTLIDEWVRSILEHQKETRVAILSHDPSGGDRGGLLGDRASMVYSQDDRVFLRSLATRGELGGLAARTEAVLEWLVSEEAGFDLVFVETVGTGQEALPFESKLIEEKVLVLHPEYGARLQLQKILMLEEADVVVINKSDWSGAERASEEVSSLVPNTPVILTHASQHKDAGVAALRKELMA